MNSMGSFLNIMTPFRLGEIYRYSFMRKRYQSNRTIILNAIAIERLIDSGCLIIVMVTLYGFNTLNVLQLQAGFFLLLLTIYITVFAFLSKVSLRTRNSTVTKQIFFLGNVRSKEIFILLITIWTSYLLAGFLAVFVYSDDFRSWLNWNISSFRIVNFKSGEIILYQKYNALFVLTFLFFGLAIAFFGHKSNKILDFLTSSKSDSLSRDYVESVLRQDRNRDLFLAAPISKYWSEVTQKDLCAELFSGGSGALVFSLRSDPDSLRKVAFGRQTSRLIDQYEYLKQHSQKWSFPIVENPIFGRDYFSFDMEKIHPSKTLYETLELCEKKTDIESNVIQIFNFIDSANSNVGLIDQSDFRRHTEFLWTKKLQEILNQAKLQMPWLFVNPRIDINGNNFKNLEVVFEEIKLIAFTYRGISTLTNPHGDSTLGNLLIKEGDLKIRGIDPNPNQTIKNVSIDHGKVLQSLMGRYESLMVSGNLLEARMGNVSYSHRDSNSIAVASKRYLHLLALDSDVFVHSQIMCFASMMRLLPYRLEQDRRLAPIYAARTIELGNQILGTIR